MHAGRNPFLCSPIFSCFTGDFPRKCRDSEECGLTHHMDTLGNLCITQTIHTKHTLSYGIYCALIALTVVRCNQNITRLLSNLNGRWAKPRLTQRDRVTHICVSKLTNTGSDNCLSPGRRQAIIWTNAGILLIRTSGTNLGGILIEIDTFPFKNMHLETPSAKWGPLCPVGDELRSGHG